MFRLTSVKYIQSEFPRWIANNLLSKQKKKYGNKSIQTINNALFYEITFCSRFTFTYEAKDFDSNSVNKI